MTTNFRHNISIYDIDDYSNMMEVRFLDSGSCYYEFISEKANVSKLDVFTVAREILPSSVFNFGSNSFYVTDGVESFVRVTHDSIDDETNDTSSGKYNVSIWSKNIADARRIKEAMKVLFDGNKTYSVTWAYTDATGNINHKEIFLEEREPPSKEFYPWLPGSTVHEYQTNYLDSPESVLLLTGVPGTGKTTFIRDMITSNKLNATITYDEKLIGSDQFFIDFINDKNKDILVIEDADSMLLDREKEENFMLSKLLNVSDGLVKNVSKKIVFSTNITDVEIIDSALLRPGRCYDILDFRKLTHEETLAVVEAKGLSREFNEERDRTLAEIFSSNGRDQTFVDRKVGFR